MLNAIIMASGLSKRMGENKLLLPFKGKYLIETTMDLVRNCEFLSPVLVSNNELILTLGSKNGIKTVFNPYPERGQSESVKLGVLNSTETLGYAFFAGDMPLTDKSLVVNLHETFLKHPDAIVLPAYQGKTGLPSFFGARFKDELLALSGDSGGKTVIAGHKKAVIMMETENSELFFDIDTKADYLSLLKLLKARDEKINES